MQTSMFFFIFSFFGSTHASLPCPNRPLRRGLSHAFLQVAPLLQPEGLSEVEAALGEPLTFLPPGDDSTSKGGRGRPSAVHGTASFWMVSSVSDLFTP